MVMSHVKCLHQTELLKNVMQIKKRREEVFGVSLFSLSLAVRS